MNNTAKIIIGILIVVCGFLIVFSKIQVSEAKKQMTASIKLAKENEKLKAEVQAVNTRAERLAAHAIEAQMESMQLLEDCKGSK